MTWCVRGLMLAAALSLSVARPAAAQVPEDWQGAWISVDDQLFAGTGLIIPVYEVLTIAGDGAFTAGYWSAAWPYSRRIERAISDHEFLDGDLLDNSWGDIDLENLYPLFAEGTVAIEPQDPGARLTVTVDTSRDIVRDRRDTEPRPPWVAAPSVTVTGSLAYGTLVIGDAQGQRHTYRPFNLEIGRHLAALITTIEVSAVQTGECLELFLTRLLRGESLPEQLRAYGTESQYTAFVRRAAYDVEVMDAAMRFYVGRFGSFEELMADWSSPEISTERSTLTGTRLALAFARQDSAELRWFIGALEQGASPEGLFGCRVRY